MNWGDLPAPRSVRSPRWHERVVRPITAIAWRHWLFLLVLAAGAIMRAYVQFTYEPAIFFADSFPYLGNAVTPEPDTQRPLGYSIVFLRPLLIFGNLAVIPGIQHLLGLGMAAAIYAMLLHHRVRAWLSALAVTPVLLDGFQLQIEENIASDSFFQALLVGALVLLTWRRSPPPAAVAVAGLLVGISATVRFVGLPLAAVLLLYVLVVRTGWYRRVIAAGVLLVATALPLLVYSSWTYTQTGEFRAGGDRMSGRALQARAAPFADCGALAEGGAPVYILRLCPDAPRSERPPGPQYYMRKSLFGSPDIGLPPDVGINEARREFAMRVFVNQPLGLVGAVMDDFLRGFAWKRTREPGEWPLVTWRFPTHVRYSDLSERPVADLYVSEDRSLTVPRAERLRAYQYTVYTRGPVFAAGILIPLVAATGFGGASRSGLRAPSLLIAGTGVGALLVAAGFAFAWRYQLPAIPLLPWAAVLGLAALFPNALSERPSAGRRAAADTDGTAADIMR